MQSLKKKFGKFAVSNEMASKLVGGTQYCCNQNPTSICRTNFDRADRLCAMAGLPPAKALVYQSAPPN